jgi:hypothetical protein
MGMMYRFLGVMELRSSIKEHESIFLRASVAFQQELKIVLEFSQLIDRFLNLKHLSMVRACFPLDCVEASCLPTSDH